MKWEFLARAVQCKVSVAEPYVDLVLGINGHLIVSFSVELRPIFFKHILPSIILFCNHHPVIIAAVINGKGRGNGNGRVADSIKLGSVRTDQIGLVIIFRPETEECRRKLNLDVPIWFFVQVSPVLF